MVCLLASFVRRVDETTMNALAIFLVGVAVSANTVEAAVGAKCNLMAFVRVLSSERLLFKIPILTDFHNFIIFDLK